MAGMKDVAELAGVSLTTVSHVINGTRRVHPDTEKRVHEAIASLDYRPSRAAQSLRKQRSWNIGIIVCSMSSQFFLEIMQHGQALFEAQGFHLSISFSELESSDGDRGAESAFARESAAVESLLRKDVEAIILDSVLPDAELARLLAATPVPVILFQRSLHLPLCYSVCSDDYQGGRLAASHVLELGHRRIAVVEGFSYESHATSKRSQGIVDRLAEAGLELPAQYRQVNCYVSEQTYEQTQQLLRLPEPPSAILYYSDIQAIVGVRAAADMGLKVPQDLSIIGYDNIQIARWALPRLTTINQDAQALARALVQVCSAAIAAQNGQEPGREPAPTAVRHAGLKQELLPVSLVRRESTGMWAGSLNAGIARG